MHESVTDGKQPDGYDVSIATEIVIIGEDGNIDSIGHGTNENIDMGPLYAPFPA